MKFAPGAAQVLPQATFQPLSPWCSSLLPLVPSRCTGMAGTDSTGELPHKWKKAIFLQNKGGMSHAPAPQACRHWHFRLEGILSPKAAPRVAASSPSQQQKKQGWEALVWLPTKQQAQRPEEALAWPGGAVATQADKTTGRLSKTSGWPLLEVVTLRTRPSHAEMPNKGSCQPVSALKSPLTCTFLEHVLGLLARDEFYPPSSLGSK